LVELVVGSTSTLAHQIENGVPADIFFSAKKALVFFQKFGLKALN